MEESIILLQGQRFARLNLPSEQRAEPLSDFIPITWDHSKFQGRKSMLNQLLLSFTASRPKDV
jgi:hypothetical protein